MLSFLHLSDIHFHKESGNPFDVDEDLRNGILNDVTEFAGDHPKPDGILVSGDLAYSGSESEYQIAKEWLESICQSVGRDLGYVYCVPGNHDVDQRRVRESELLADIHATLRDIDPSEIDQKLLKFIGDERAKGMLYETIEQYNIFARHFECEISPKSPTWIANFELDDGSILRVNGLNSSMVSNHLDNVVKEVVLGRYQIPKETPGIVQLAMCHHPPDWWRDDERVEFDLRERCRIQLFGHKHSHRLERMGDTVVVSAGAVHPERTEDSWSPRFNWFEVQVDGRGSDRKLQVKVFPRVLNGASFVADSLTCQGEDHKEYVIDLPSWTPPVGTAEAGSGSQSLDISSAVGNTDMNRGRTLTYRFYELPYVTRLSISQELGLIRDEDETVGEATLFRQVLRRANAEDLLADLWDRVEENHEDQLHSSNPYRTH